jgi:hypothetical protein
MIHVEVGTYEQINVSRLQANHGQLFDDIFPHFWRGKFGGGWKFAGKPLSINMFLPLLVWTR